MMKRLFKRVRSELQTFIRIFNELRTLGVPEYNDDQSVVEKTKTNEHSWQSPRNMAEAMALSAETK